jgi:hypothetical protein
VITIGPIDVDDLNVCSTMAVRTACEVAASKLLEALTAR